MFGSFSTRVAALGVLGLATISSAAIVSFRDGVSGYTGTADTTLFGDQPANNNGTSANMFLGAGTTSSVTGPRQILMRFDSIFGTNPGQIPPGSTINSATVEIWRGNQGGFDGSIRIYDLVTPFGETTSTYNSFVGGVDIGTDTDPAATDPAAKTLSSSVPSALFNVTSSLVGWSTTPTDNLGWAILTPGTGFLHVNSSNAVSPTVGNTPILTVDFTAPPVPEPVTLGLLGSLGLTLIARRKRAV
jgi:hypothetical protein